jgi:hypothetical protein
MGARNPVSTAVHHRGNDACDSGSRRRFFFSNAEPTKGAVMRLTVSRPKRVLVVALFLLAAAPGWAADQEAAPNTGALSLTVALTFPTSDYFRGIAQSNAGFQFQPYVELKGNLYEGGEKDILTGAYVKAAGWSHFQSVAAPIATNYYE